MSDGTNILDTLWHSMKRFTLRQGYAPAYVELGKDEMRELDRAVKSLNRELAPTNWGRPGFIKKVYDVEVRERPDGITLKKWGEMLRS